MKILLANGAKVNLAPPGGVSPLAAAARVEGPIGMQKLKLLVERGADVDFENGWMTPLQAASSALIPENVDFLLSRGANPNKANKDGYTALHDVLSRVEHWNEQLAVGKSDYKMPKWLKQSSQHIVRALLQRGADPNARGGGGV